MGIPGKWKGMILALVALVPIVRKTMPWLSKLALGLKARIAAWVLDKTIKDITGESGNRCEIGTKRAKDGEVFRYFKNAPTNLRALFSRLEEHGDKDFLVYWDVSEGRHKRLTFKETIQAAGSLQKALASELHVKPGDRVAILMSNILEFPISFIAVTSLGAVAVNMNAFWSGELIQFGLEDSKCSVLITDSKRLARLEEVQGLEALMRTGLRVVVTDREDSGLINFGTLVTLGEKQSEMPSVHDMDPDEVACIMYTSGTSSKFPKGVCLTHESMCQVTFSYILFKDVLNKLERKSDMQRCDLVTSPLFHAASFASVFLLGAWNGNKLVFLSKWESDAALDACLAESVTFLSLMPTMLNDLLFNPRFKEEAPKLKITTIGTGGAACPPELTERLKQVLPHISRGTGWGLTESNATGTSFGGPEYLNNPTSCGRALALVDVKVVDPQTGQDVMEPGVEGELCVRSICNMKEYWGLPLETEKAFYPHGWLRTGDLGKIDSSGYVYITDRIKDIVIRGGENISCSLIEDTIMRFNRDDIREVAVFGLPDKRLGEQLCAVITTTRSQGGRPLTGQDVRAFVSKHLSSHMVPVEIFIRDAKKRPLPRGPTGKILKRVLREEYAEFADSDL